MNEFFWKPLFILVMRFPILPTAHRGQMTIQQLRQVAVHVEQLAKLFLLSEASMAERSKRNIKNLFITKHLAW